MKATGSKGLLERLKGVLQNTTRALADRFVSLFARGRLVDRPFLDELEETLITADVAVETVARVRAELEDAFRARRVRDAAQAREYLKTRFKEMLRAEGQAVPFAPSGPTVALVCGVNGSGKTTSIAKLARFYGGAGKKVLLAAADTFRAAAIDQLEIWSQRLGVPLIKHQHGADPAAVAFDAADAAAARGMDLLIIDTAGRLQTRENLMRELEKIRAVVARKIPGAPHASLLVLDATTGQNALSQAKHFGQAAGITGIFLAKLDGTARGGAVLSIRDQLGLPVRFVGLGETPEDIEPFDADAFVDALFEP
jgi:fused signal recognition particle receptor